MKLYIVILSLLALLSSSFTFQNDTDTVPSPESEPSKYDGPIIDMHIHAFDKQSSFGRMLGREMHNPLTGKTYQGSASMDILREETFQKFKEHNIVKAMVSQGELWYDFAPEKIIIGNSHYLSMERLR